MWVVALLDWEDVNRQAAASAMFRYTLVHSCTCGIVLCTDCYHVGLNQASSKGMEKL